MRTATTAGCRRSAANTKETTRTELSAATAYAIALIEAFRRAFVAEQDASTACHPSMDAAESTSLTTVACPVRNRVVDPMVHVTAAVIFLTGHARRSWMVAACTSAPFSLPHCAFPFRARPPVFSNLPALHGLGVLTDIDLYTGSRSSTTFAVERR